MSKITFPRRTTTLAAVALLGWGATALLQPIAQAQPPVKLPPQNQNPPGEVRLPPQGDAELPPAEEIPAPVDKATRYWIGVMCHAVEDALRAHIALPEGQGLTVADVVPDGPAAAAGIARHDILLTAGGVSLAAPRDLVGAVTASGDTALNVELLRKGKQLTINVTPARRPAVSRPVLIGAGEQDELRAWMQNLQEQMQDRRAGDTARDDGQERRAEGRQRRPVRMRFLQPGREVNIPLPEGMSFSISRDANGRLRVRQGGEDMELGGGESGGGKLGELLEGLVGSGELGGLLGGVGGGSPAGDSPATEELLPNIEIPGLEEDGNSEAAATSGNDFGLPPEAFAPGDDLAPVEPVAADEKTKAANRLPAATAEDAELEEVGATIRELQEQLREIRKQRRARRANKAAEKKETEEQKKAVREQDAAKDNKEDDDSEPSEGTI